jgi:hypothetical protein
MYILTSYWDGDTRTELFESLSTAKKVAVEYEESLVCTYAEVFKAVGLGVPLAKGDCAHCNV